MEKKRGARMGRPLFNASSADQRQMRICSASTRCIGWPGLQL